MTPPSQPGLTIVIPTLGLRGLLQASLWALERAIEEQTLYPRTQVVVVDNASPIPLSLTELGGADEVLRFDSHHSFASCINAGASRNPKDDVLLLNNDCFVHPQALQRMGSCLADASVGIVGARLVFPDGSMQHAGVGQYPEGPRHVDKNEAALPSAVTFPTAVTGALMLIRRETFEALGGLDETYDFGSEDIDFCHRARQKGWRIACEQSVESLHLESSTPGRADRDVPSRRLYQETWKHRVTHEFLEGTHHV